MAMTIGEMVKYLETCNNPDELVNVGSFKQCLEAKKVGTKYVYYVSSILDNWDCLQFNHGTSRVGDFLRILKPYLPTYKDKQIAI